MSLKKTSNLEDGSVLEAEYQQTRDLTGTKGWFSKHKPHTRKTIFLYSCSNNQKEKSHAYSKLIGSDHLILKESRLDSNLVTEKKRAILPKHYSQTNNIWAPVDICVFNSLYIHTYVSCIHVMFVCVCVCVCVYKSVRADFPSS